MASRRSIVWRRPRLWVAILCQSAALLVALAGPSATAVASTTCASVDSNYFDGGVNDPVTFQPWGARANVLRPATPNLCGSGPSGEEDSSVWVMLAGDGSDYEYAQIGYIWKNYGSGANRFFLEWSESKGGASSQVFWGDPVTGDTYDMRASYYPRMGTFI